MKKSIKILAAAALTLTAIFTTACKSNSNTLYLYNWTYYTPESLLKSFEEEFDCKVRMDNYSTCDEMYTKIKAGAKGYDVVVPSNDYVSIMLSQGMLREIDQSKFTNRQYISEEVLAKMDFDPVMKYAVPYALSATGVIVNKTKVTNPNYSRNYDIFNDPQFAGHATMMDEMREVLGCALVYNGLDLNSTDPKDLKVAFDTVQNEWKNGLVKFDAEGFGKSFANGDLWLCQGYPEIAFGEVDESRWDETIDFFIPECGGPATLDCMVILKDAPHYELANEFINFIHRPENYAVFIDTFRYPCVVNPAALEYVTKQPMYDFEQANKCTLKQDLGENLDKYNDLWEKIRFAQ